MSVQVQRETGDAQRVSVQVSGRFDFRSHQEFLNNVTPLFGEAALQHLQIDLSGVSYIDSAALGALMLLRERVRSEGRQVSLHRPSPVAADILNVAMFSKLFEIEWAA